MTTICGYELVDVRRSLRDAIDQRNRRAANRWTAELVATPGAVGSLWASYWLAWVDGAPTLPILLRQSWATVEAAAQGHGDWVAFRNDPDVRAAAAEMTTRLLNQPRPTPVVWPTKEITLYDIGVIHEQTVPAAADSRAVMSVWKRGEDDMEIRILAVAYVFGDGRYALGTVDHLVDDDAGEGEVRSAGASAGKGADIGDLVLAGAGALGHIGDEAQRMADHVRGDIACVRDTLETLDVVGAYARAAGMGAPVADLLCGHGGGVGGDTRRSAHGGD